MNPRPAREFLDTNVLVYAHERNGGERHRIARVLVEDLLERDAAALSVQVLQEFFVTVTAKLPRPLAVAEAAEIVADLAALTTHAPGESDVLAAIDIHRRLVVTFWDAMMLRSAMVLGCEVVWSEDLAHGRRYDDVEVRNPFAS